tara:strand:- start:1149 stop:2369 length:1221 start_codon:yes stop_codon:yes gene_type:complete
MTDSLKKEKILVLASSFPRWANDSSVGGGAFIVKLSEGFLSRFSVYILAPGDKNSKSYEELFGFKVFRHKQFFFGNPKIAFGSGILPNIKKNKLLFFLIPFYLLLEFVELKKIIKSEKIKIIHAHWILPQGLVAVFYKKYFNPKIKILATINGSDFWGFNNFIGRYLKKYVLKNIDELTVPNSDIKIGVKNLGYLKKTHVFPMGIDTNFFIPEKKEFNIKKTLGINGPFLLFVGTLVEEKGIRFLVESMSKISDKYPRVVLLIIGQGNLKKEMLELVKKNNLDKNIQFVNDYINYEDLPKYFATCDIFILPSLTEGFPMAFMEAISCETYTIVSEIPVFKTLLKEHEISFLVKTRSPDDISCKVIDILNNFENYNLIKKKARKYVVKNHDWKVVQENYLNIALSMI